MHFPEGVKRYIKYCQELDEPSGRPYTSRYIGSLVSDLHRNLLKGGIYLYPTGTKSPKGKLRLLYECNPLAFITEQAGGRATDGYQRIMDIKPEELHQRVAYFVGSTAMVLEAESFIQQRGSFVDHSAAAPTLHQRSKGSFLGQSLDEAQAW